MHFISFVHLFASFPRCFFAAVSVAGVDRAAEWLLTNSSGQLPHSSAPIDGSGGRTTSSTAITAEPPAAGAELYPGAVGPEPCTIDVPTKMGGGGRVGPTRSSDPTTVAGVILTGPCTWQGSLRDMARHVKECACVRAIQARRINFIEFPRSCDQK